MRRKTRSDKGKKRGSYKTRRSLKSRVRAMKMKKFRAARAERLRKIGL